ncbi:hypothetical protein FDE98_14855 [Clostridium sporogenes]|uniref:Uncharacterized protein n=1 Tax=Clostridium sporogenes TaxID=1509 RepID=A0A7X5SZG3_CLOSG|nr:hypothetical protein [Clostridium sporogenes]AJD29356.1 hypothetical protein T258_3893 [Clostridium botulinum Prevot_594]NFL97872.1 hypothetical protein [Clostridium botulinum]NFP55396.1 hypothetical protein [Clostridium botulinum]NFQ18063.1 hypothetical protein [Clostridium sporogenes]NFQ21890.1 hypothetical protein [Clostridium sporogenes]
MKKINLKKRALNHVKKGLNHLDINHSLEVKNYAKEVRQVLKNEEITEKECYVLLRVKIRKGLSNKWNGSKKWHKECDKLMSLLSKY